jgi:hypothetical protein
MGSQGFEELGGKLVESFEAMLNKKLLNSIKAFFLGARAASIGWLDSEVEVNVLIAGTSFRSEGNDLREKPPSALQMVHGILLTHIQAEGYQ